jgi:ribosome biogenesis GTPase A
MQKAKRQIEEKLKLIDIVFVLVDARCPKSSFNPMLDDVLKRKKKLILLTKIDLADDSQTKKWIKFYKDNGMHAVGIDSINRTGLNQIVKETKIVLKDKIAKDKAKGMKERPVRALIVGAPNVGKSTLINRLSGKKVANVGNRPGVTKAQQWIRLTKDLELLDTPGILWPKFEDEYVGYHLAISGIIKDEILPKDEVAIFALRFMEEHYPQLLEKRYGISELDEDIALTFDHIAKRRGCIGSGGFIDYDRVSDIIRKDIRDGLFGPVTFDRYED